MADYISREAALLKLMQDGCSAKNVQSITEIPAADVEPVVRCRECRYWDDDPDTYGRSGGPLGNCDRMDCTTAHDDFCSYGERKED